MNISNYVVGNGGTLCPFCNDFTVKKISLSSGDSLFIGTIDSKTKSIFADQGIMCDAYLCEKCGNIQLKAKRG